MINTGFGDDSLSRFVTLVYFKLLKDGWTLTEVYSLCERTSPYRNDDVLMKFCKRVLNDPRFNDSWVSKWGGNLDLSWNSNWQFTHEKDCFQISSTVVDIRTNGKSVND